jgi:biotin operon repressor
MASPRKWYDVYENSDEYNFFIGKDRKSGLVRNKAHVFRSPQKLAEEAGISLASVEKIIAKYIQEGIIVPSTSSENLYAYWENTKNKSAPTGKTTIAENDKKAKVAGNSKP